MAFRPRTDHGNREPGNETDVEELVTPIVIALKPGTTSAANLNMVIEIGAKVQATGCCASCAA